MANIADDLIVHGQDMEENGKNLKSVLKRLSEKQLAVNADKCTFRMTRVVFMGLFLTKHGIGPTEDKVRAVVKQVDRKQLRKFGASWGSWDSVQVYS